MQLWTDYEGITIDGTFPLGKLLLPEGRSAFFATAGPQGEPTVARLIECHFDEEEILARWRSVDALSHPNFLKSESFGQTELDGRPVVYAVFEKVDANLAEVLDQGHLAVPDVTQLASSLVAALDVLHTHGFIHEHVEPRNIFAIDSVVKLRADCIREAPEGEEGRFAKQRDVHDLAKVLLLALTQRESIAGIPDSALPPPFAQMIRNGLDGTWGLEDIKAALHKAGPKQPATPTPVSVAPPTTPAIPQRAPIAAGNPSTNPAPQLPLPLHDEDRDARSISSTARRDTGHEDDSFSLRSRWVRVAIAGLLLLLSIWGLAHIWNAHKNKAPQVAAPSQPVAPSPKQSVEQTPTIPVPTPAAASNLPAPADSRAGWRVITFTYNRSADAEKKVSSLARTHPELTPSVFTPSGHAPYLVSVGGVMDRDAAHALVRRSRSLGLPHDMYAQNYSR